MVLAEKTDRKYFGDNDQRTGDGSWFCEEQLDVRAFSGLEINHIILWRHDVLESCRL